MSEPKHTGSEFINTDMSRLIAAAPDMLAVLKSIEWSGLNAMGYRSECPVCGGTPPREGNKWSTGHDHECELKAAIDKATR